MKMTLTVLYYYKLLIRSPFNAKSKRRKNNMGIPRLLDFFLFSLLFSLFFQLTSLNYYQHFSSCPQPQHLQFYKQNKIFTPKQQEIENSNFKTMKRTCTKLGRDVTLGSRGYFFLIDTDRSQQSHVNQARSANSLIKLQARFISYQVF